jgi:hypothetical protein
MRILLSVLCLTLIPAANCVNIVFPPDDQVCTTLYAYGVSATVTNTDTNQPITDAVLTLHEGDYVEVMQPFPSGGFAGARERPGFAPAPPHARATTCSPSPSPA